MTDGVERVPLRLRGGAIALLLVAGALQCWRYRHHMYPDGSQYVDVGMQFQAAGFAGLLNGCWSPLYPAMLGTMWWLAPPSRYWLYPSVQVINLLDFAAAVFAFDYFLGAVIRYRTRDTSPDDTVWLSPGTLAVAAYATFAVTVVYLLNVRTMSPDMIVAAALFLVSGLLLNARREPGRTVRWMAIGAVLAIGYLAKTVMFPAAILYLGVALVAGHGPQWRRGVIVAATIFLAVSLPWLVGLSIWKGRPTYGDTGNLAYASWVDKQPLPWSGEQPGSGVALHPAQRLFTRPDAFAFPWPKPVTYALFYDPTYWNDGIKPRWSIDNQLRALGRTVRELGGIFREGFLVLGPVLLVLVGLATDWRGAWHRLWGTRVVWLPAGAAIGLYMLVHIEGRLVAGQLEVIIVIALSSLAYARARMHRLDQVAAAACVVAAAVTAGPVAAGAARNSLADLRAGESRERMADWGVAEALTAQGLTPGDRVAVIGNLLDVTWAQLASLSIVAEVSSDQLPAYLSADPETQAAVLDAFRQLGVRAVVARSGDAAFGIAPWSRMPGTEFALLQFDTR